VTPDVNVLVAASRADHAHYPVARSWLESAVTAASRAEPLIILPVVAVGFVRVATGAHAFTVPTPLRDALTTVGGILAMPHVRLGVHDREWPAFAELCERRGLAGAPVTDAWIAAAVLEHREHLVTFDRGFRRLLPPRALTVLRA
jgi:toxin-antitoxin system PIN domain toxin